MFALIDVMKLYSKLKLTLWNTVITSPTVLSEVVQKEHIETHNYSFTKLWQSHHSMYGSDSWWTMDTSAKRHTANGVNKNEIF